MFLKLDGATGESSDSAHKDEIAIYAWSWALQAPGSLSGGTGGHVGAASLSEFRFVKKADRATTALMSILRANKVLGQALLTVRKAGEGDKALEYLTIQLEKVRVTSISVTVDEPAGGGPPEVRENVSLGFARVTVNYRPQTGSGSGAGTGSFTADAHMGA
jgi:type VI secretion system secreted protein Hcp